MNKTVGFPLAGFTGVWILLLCAPLLFGGSPNTYQITPDQTTMLVGESRQFRMVDQDGRAQLKVTWTLSDADAFERIEGDEVQLVPKRTGEFRLTARTDFATAEATVKVVDRSTALEPGTKKWTSGAAKGCHTVKLIPAAAMPNGPFVYQQTVCEDGEYLAAYTYNGVQLWRRKISDHGVAVERGNDSYEDMGQHLEAHSTSICDSISVGNDQQKVRELLAEHNLSFHEQPNIDRVWLVEEAGTQCKVSFDQKLIVSKKQKVFVAE